MGRQSPESFEKRQRERRKLQKRAEKRERKQARLEEKKLGDVEPDGAEREPGEQPPTPEEDSKPRAEQPEPEDD